MTTSSPGQSDLGAAVQPHIVVDGAAEASAFYARVFGAEELTRLTDPARGNKVICAEMRIGDSRFSLTDEFPEWNAQGPKKIGGTAIAFTIRVSDPDAVVAEAVRSGAKVIYPIRDQFYGRREGRIEDPFGHQWIVSKFLEHVSPDEMRRRLSQWQAGESSNDRG